MARRHGPHDKSAFFFGSFAPLELANFHVQNEHLNDGGVAEMLGPRFGLWWGSEPARDFPDLLRRAADWAQVIASVYYLVSGKAVDVHLERWVEALDVDVDEAVLGFIDDRYLVVPAPKRPAPKIHPMRRAIVLAGELRSTADSTTEASVSVAAV